MKPAELIRAYAHDYRDMKMAEEELYVMLFNFSKELLELARQEVLSLHKKKVTK